MAHVLILFTNLNNIKHWFLTTCEYCLALNYHYIANNITT
jgi:hypothetical protein